MNGNNIRIIMKDKYSNVYTKVDGITSLKPYIKIFTYYPKMWSLCKLVSDVHSSIEKGEIITYIKKSPLGYNDIIEYTKLEVNNESYFNRVHNTEHYRQVIPIKNRIALKLTTKNDKKA